MPYESIRDILPSIRKYAAKQAGGSEVIRSLRDTLEALGLKQKKQLLPYKYRKHLKISEEAQEEARREQLREQGIIIRKAKNRRSSKGRKR